VLPGKKYSPEEWLAIVWRYKWALFIPAVVIAAATAVVAVLLPDQYRSETLILVVPQRVPESYVRAPVTTKIEDRLRSIQQQILTRTKLEQIVRDQKLYPREVARLPMEDVIERMRRDVRVDIVRGDAFRVSYISDTPRKAMEVAARLSSLFINESLSDRSVFAEQTTDFLQSQLEDARRRLTEQERKVADFQRAHAGELPSERATNLQVLSNLQTQVASLSESANRDRDRRLFLEHTVAEIEGELKALRAVPPPASAPDSAAGVVAGATAAEQLQAARENLRLLELRLKPGHPDVAYARRVIRDLEAKVKAQEGVPLDVASSGSQQSPPRAVRPEESAVMKRLHDTRQELAAIETQIASKQAEERRMRDQMSQFERRVGATPAIEAEFTALTRDYETLRVAYQNLLAKREDSEMAAALERRQIGEQFKTLDPARLPEAPFSPNRVMINVGGIFGGLATGLGLVMLLAYRDRSVRTEADLGFVVKAPVLAAIPTIDTNLDRRRRRRRRLLAAAGAVVMCLAIVGAAAYAFKAGMLHAPLWLR
jgi:polysaccharide chain length determinant protein (PEP-CTERM system associated)